MKLPETSLPFPQVSTTAIFPQRPLPLQHSHFDPASLVSRARHLASLRVHVLFAYVLFNCRPLFPGAHNYSREHLHWYIPGRQPRDLLQASKPSALVVCGSTSSSKCSCLHLFRPCSGRLDSAGRLACNTDYYLHKLVESAELDMMSREACSIPWECPVYLVSPIKTVCCKNTARLSLHTICAFNRASSKYIWKQLFASPN